MTQSQQDRLQINQMLAELGRYRNNPGEFFPREMRAQRALAAWREKYPEEAKEERRSALLARADELKSKASGALTYDMDGSLDAAARRANHDKWIADAQKLTDEANAL